MTHRPSLGTLVPLLSVLVAALAYMAATQDGPPDRISATSRPSASLTADRDGAVKARAARAALEERRWSYIAAMAERDEALKRVAWIVKGSEALDEKRAANMPGNMPRARARAPVVRADCRYAIPCEIVMHESGGNYSTNTGNGYYGAYQFSSQWACRLGLPCDLASATPEQQDAAAALLWNGGAGCGNWSGPTWNGCDYR